MFHGVENIIFLYFTKKFTLPKNFLPKNFYQKFFTKKFFYQKFTKKFSTDSKQILY